MPNANRRRHVNPIPLTLIVTWGLIGIAACAGGLDYVWCKHQLFATGTEIKALERDLAETRNKNEVALSKIAQLSSTSKLQERYSSGFLKLVPISNDHTVLIGADAPAAKAGELRAVANERKRE